MSEFSCFPTVHESSHHSKNSRILKAIYYYYGNQYTGLVVVSHIIRPTSAFHQFTLLIVTFTQHNDTDIYTISQEKFFRAANVNDTEIEKRKKAQRDYSWMLPLSYQTNLQDFQPQFHILNKSQCKPLPLILFHFHQVWLAVFETVTN